VRENGTTVLTSPTALGTYPIYVRYTGSTPDGSYYGDPVYWIDYYDAGAAVHGFARAPYGSLAEQVAFNHLAVGDLVTVGS
jgi:hypothetical protein